jgi:hypothetical protein
MSKFTPEQKNEIITLKLQGTKAKEIMEKFNVSRAYIYKMLKENDIDYKSEVNTQLDITEINEIDSDDIFNDLNDDATKTEEMETYKPNSPDPEPEIELEQPQIQKPFLSSINLQSSSRVNNYVSPEKLNTLKMLNSYDEIKTKTLNTHNAQSRQTQIKIDKDPTLSEDYPDIQNTMNVIKRYIESYYDTGKLDDIVGNDKRTFVLRLNELDLYQLKVLLSNIQFKLSSSNSSKLFESGFFLISSQVESTACYLNYDITGLTQALRHNEEIHECLKELSCKYDVTKYVSPESRLIMAVSLSAYSIYNQNNMKSKFNAFLEKPVDEKIQNSYKNL